MQDKILLYKPKRRGRLTKSAMYALPMFAKTMTLCSDLLLRTLGTKRIKVSVVDEYINKFWRMHFAESFTSLYATGLDWVAKNETYIFMSNHESWMDIPAMFGAVPSSLRMVSKIGLMKVPVLGHAMANAGFIAVDRKNRSRAIRQLDHAKMRLSEGVSIWMAPEGTRSRDGSIGAFKKGGFYLAKELNMPIMPVYIEGASLVMPADSLTVYPNKSITVHFCEPVTADDVAHRSNSELMEMVRKRIIEKSESIREFNNESS